MKLSRCSEWSPCDVLVATLSSSSSTTLWFGSVCFSANGACFYFSTHIYELIYFGTVPVSTKREYIKWRILQKDKCQCFGTKTTGTEPSLEYLMKPLMLFS